MIIGNPDRKNDDQTDYWQIRRQSGQFNNFRSSQRWELERVQGEESCGGKNIKAANTSTTKINAVTITSSRLYDRLFPFL